VAPDPLQDNHLAEAAGTKQVWTSQGWVKRFGLPFDPGTPATGIGPPRSPPWEWSPCEVHNATTPKGSYHSDLAVSMIPAHIRPLRGVTLDRYGAASREGGEEWSMGPATSSLAARQET
jgi:hypothetical protein